MRGCSFLAYVLLSRPGKRGCKDSGNQVCSTGTAVTDAAVGKLNEGAADGGYWNPDLAPVTLSARKGASRMSQASICAADRAGLSCAVARLQPLICFNG